MCPPRPRIARSLAVRTLEAEKPCSSTGPAARVGIAAVQLAKAAGMRVIGTAGTANGRALVLEQGADAVFDHHDPARLSAIKAVSDGRGPDVILEMLANVNLDLDLGLLAPGGRVVVIGNRGRTEIDARQTMGKELSILGMSLWNVPPEDLQRIHAALVSRSRPARCAQSWAGSSRWTRGAGTHGGAGAGAIGKIVLIRSAPSILGQGSASRSVPRPRAFKFLIGPPPSVVAIS